MEPFGPSHTHDVTNQVPPLTNYNLLASDPVLDAALTRNGAAWHRAALLRDGAALTTPEVLALADLANRHSPELFTFSPRGERIDALEFHPAWHTLLALLRQENLHALPFSLPQPGAMSARCAGYFLHAQLESGSLCPLTMTFASIPLLQREPALFETLRDKLYSSEHDPRDLPLPLKRSAMIGMGMTEKQGGSDVRSNQTRAFATQGSGRGASYRLVGHKWFFSAPQCDAHLVLARTGEQAGLSCFYVPRFAPDGSKNTVQVQRLKNKLGNRSNASSEVEFNDAFGILIGDEGRGVPTIIEMANYTRLDCVIGSAALMRAALVQAIHHARHRSAFGRTLLTQPLMRNVLADLALESEAATVLFMRLARAFEDTASAPQERAWQRIVTPAAKYWVCKRTLEFTGEAMEVWGGNGYVEEGPMARFYREAPVNSIWEGSGNVMCLDVLRAIEREPEAAQALLASWHTLAQGEPGLQAALARLTTALAADAVTREASARRIAQQIALLAQATLLLQHAPADVADAFIATRLADGCGESGRVYGTLPAHVDHAALVERAFLMG
ncbi:isovaleryl-CoA dehydrogenase [Paraburkholderia bonniea]|uniref:isovaleryl-CoA dehydrogenase n=1 Tax=Paraburkholderia bonniea TaxID=2152891 RepID=UPI001291496A|nr:isovaleryl-CoA dehydrogenase [Paraburkholderia bonniea]WJF90479.1 isovaleryl-CoA dehydrogenase [Paraburkholderia bonniea]WJF93794.1 isovaleryl-CoA dehydrogenase [Paraburkholderia bonniea]